MKYRLCLVVAAGLLMSAQPLADSGRCFALLIGINDYLDESRPGISDLQCTNDDVKLMESMIETLTGVPLEQQVVVELLDEKATKDNILAALKDFEGKAGPSDSLVIYFSGHGALVPDFDGDEPAGDGALILHDFERYDRPPREEEVGAGTITDDEMSAILRVFSPLRQVFYITDCCHSGGNERDVTDVFDKGFEFPLTADQMLARGRKAIMPMADENLLAQRNVIAIFACDSKQKAQEIRSVGNGAMTDCLSRVLSEPGAYDADMDGVLELEELSLGLRSLVDRTVKDYSGGAKGQTSYVKFLSGDIWAMDAAAAAVETTEVAYAGIVEDRLQGVIDTVLERSAGRYDTGEEPYRLLEFGFVNHDGSSRADNVYLESEMVQPGETAGATLDWKFSLDAPASVISLLVFTDGTVFTAFPNSPEMVEASMFPVTKTGCFISEFPFTIPSSDYFRDTKFVLQMPPYGWEYVVLICSPVPLDNPHIQGDSAFDLVYPFEALSGAALEEGPGITKGFGSEATEEAAAGEGDTVPGKRLTVFYRKYWLVK